MHETQHKKTDCNNQVEKATRKVIPFITASKKQIKTLGLK
jgi:hypothetical protein